MEQSNARFMKRILFGIIAVFTLIIIALYGSGFRLVREKVLVLYDVEAGKRHILAVPSGEFDLSFIHSVHHSPVVERYRIGPQAQLILYELRYSEFGVGMPSDEENGTLSMSGNQFVLTLTREFPEIHLRISPIPKHEIIVDGRAYPLLKFVKQEGLIRLSATKRWLIKRL